MVNFLFNLSEKYLPDWESPWGISDPQPSTYPLSYTALDIIIVKIDLYISPQTLDQYWSTLVSNPLHRALAPFVPIGGLLPPFFDVITRSQKPAYLIVFQLPLRLHAAAKSVASLASTAEPISGSQSCLSTHPSVVIIYYLSESLFTECVYVTAK